MPNTPNQQSFAQELKEFITNHPYYQQLQGTHSDIPKEDKETFTIHDPDGDYEELHIILNYIP